MIEVNGQRSRSSGARARLLLWLPLVLPVALAAVPLLGGAPPTLAPEKVIDTSKPFEHDTHLDATKVNKALTCSSCHAAVDAAGKCPKEEMRFPKHEACAGCHNANFYVQPLTICVTCHKTPQFVEKNPMRDLGRQDAPRKAEFSHKTHLTKVKATCTECHAFVRGGLEVSHPSHPNCCACHTKDNVKPAMTTCEGCHSEAKAATRPRSLIHDFSHKQHNVDPRTGSSTVCTQCHVNTAGAATIRTIPTPPMAACVECHDGSDATQPNPRNPAIRGSGAFHFTQCMKCHLQGSIDPSTPPATHRARPGGP